MMQDLVPIEIDLDKLKDEQMDESWLVTFGWLVKKLLRSVLGDVSIPVHLKGNPADVSSFLTTLSAEKQYMQTLQQSGLKNPQTYRNKATLDASVKKFERNTGLKWPFK
tara:strand:- start:207 stop:533 length:327 start_codon:yes stop_codon:yes gene_type:complete